MTNKTKMTLQPNNSKVRGVLFEKESFQHCDLTRFWPSSSLRSFVEQYWFVQWNLPAGTKFEHANIPHPAVNITFEQTRRLPELAATIFGPTSRRFTRWLEGEVSILGIKFQPGGFRAFVDSPVSRLANRRLPLQESHSLTELSSVVDLADLDKTIFKVERYFQKHRPAADPKVELVGQIVKTIGEDHSIVSVDQVADQFALSLRTLQRLFQNYVGVSPKCVIRKYRMQETLERLQAGETNWQNLVCELGYFDQAHFIRDFRDTIGLTPSSYLKRIQGS